MRRAYLTGLFACGLTVSIGGHYGAMLVFGSDYITSAVPFLAEGEATLRSRVIRGFLLCTSRFPDDETIAILESAHRRERRYFDEHPDGAQRVVESDEQGTSASQEGHVVAELAAWTLTANVLLNMDETITKQ